VLARFCWGAVAVALEQPVLVVGGGELADGGAELLEGGEALDPEGCAARSAATSPSQPRPTSASRSGRAHAAPAPSRRDSGRSRGGGAVAGEGVLDSLRDLVDPAGEAPHGLERAVFAPAGDVGHRLAGDVEADGLQHAEGRAVDKHLGSLAPELLIADPERVRELVDEHPQLGVGGQGGADDDALLLGIAPALAGERGEVAELDVESELGREVLEAREELAVRVALDRLARRRERYGLCVRKWSVCETSNTVATLKSVRVRGRPVSGSRTTSPPSSVFFTVIGAKMRIPRSPLRGQRLSLSHARKPATCVASGR